ncbi:MAG: hypothetical protein JXD18_10475 [Anaerolineae bacterium]|nr:hypothetical protein [Anaerolineae bacterium]
MPLVTLILVAFLVAAPVWGPGMVNTRGGGDSPFLLQRTHQMVENLRAGVFPVRWMPDAAYGLGYPFFHYYASLPYYLAGALVLVGIDVLTALKIVQTLGFVAAGLAMYGWMWSVTRHRWAAWLAAVAYTAAPFHLVNVYVRGDSLSEFYAFIFYPLILWPLPRAIFNPGPSAPKSYQASRLLALAACALAYAALLLTHNISAFIFSPFILLYLLVLAWRERRRFWSILLTGGAVLMVGFLLAVWSWPVSVLELQYVQLGPSTEGYFHYSQHFRAANLVQSSWLFDYSIAPDLTGRSPFAMGLPQALFATLGAALLIVQIIRRRFRGTYHRSFVLYGLLISTFMITPLSQFLWDRVPFLSVVQFPWRFLSVQALFVAATTIGLTNLQPPTRNSQFLIRNPQFETRNSQLAIRNSSFVLVAGLLLSAVLLPLHPDRLIVGPADVTPERLQLYELFSGNIGTTIRYEWLPQTATPRPFTSPALVDPDEPIPAIPLDGAVLTAALVERGPVRQTWRVSGAGGGIAFPLLYWPGWEAQVDGDPAAVWPVAGSGALAIDVPPGEHTVALRLDRTPVRRVAEVASLVTALGMATWLSIAGYRAARSHSRRLTCSLAPLLLCSLVTLLPLVALSLWSARVAPSPALSDLTMDFDQMPYLHHSPGGIAFQDGPRLTSYAFSADELAPGDVLSVSMNWEALDGGPYTATLALFSPAVTRYNVLPLVEVAITLSPASRATLTLPSNIPRGLYLIQLRLFGPDGERYALTPRGHTRGVLYLRPVRVPQGPALSPDVAVLAPFGPALRLHAATITQFDPHHLVVQLTWSAAQPVAANYAISLRLLDAGGNPHAAFDTQPGYGFLPTSTWPPDEAVADRYLLSLPEGLPSDAAYRFQVVLYQVTTLEPLGQALLGDFALPLDAPFEARRPPRIFDLPALDHPLAVDFGAQVRLAGYTLAQSEQTLDLTLWWQALATPTADYTAFVHLFDPQSGENVAQSDAQPRGGAYPTSWWVAGEVVSDTVTVQLEGLPPGTYGLALGLYDYTVTRLPAVTQAGERVPDDRLVLPVDVEVEP